MDSIVYSMSQHRQAGRQNNHKTTAEMQRVNLFPIYYLPNQRMPKQHPGRDTQAGRTQSQQVAELLLAPIYQAPTLA